MTEKRFQYVRGKYKHGIHDTVKDGEYRSGHRTTYDDFDLDKLTDELNIRENRIKQLEEENEQLKQQVTHLTMYKNLFREFQKQLDGVKKKSDLDHKDFEDLIELTKGHVFDDEHGWIWLPVNDRS